MGFSCLDIMLEYHEDIMIGIYCQDMGYGVYINGALMGLDRFYWDV